MTMRELIYRFINSFKRRVFCRKDPHISDAANPLICYRCYAGELEVLAPVDRPPGSLLANFVIQRPGLVEIAGHVFDLQRDGVYRFYRLPTLSEQRIVCTGGIESLLQSVGYLLGYGDDDNKNSEAYLFKALSRRRVIAGCGTLAVVAKKLLSCCKIKVRIVVLMTLSQWGGQDDGHTLLEVADDDGTWFLYDPSFGVCFRKGGRRLSVVEFSRSKNADLELEMLPMNPGYSRFSNQGYDYDFWIGERFMSSNRLLFWYRHVGDVPLIDDKGLLYCPSGMIPESNLRQISSRYKILSDDDFFERFYR